MKIFKEEQRFTQTWLLVLLVVSVLLPIILIIKEYTAKNTTMTTNQFVLTLGGIILSVSFIFFFRLVTRIDEHGVHYQFFPFHFKFRTKKWSAINKIYVKKYNDIPEYGGWDLKSEYLRK